MQASAGFFDVFVQYIGNNLLYFLVIFAWIWFVLQQEKKTKMYVILGTLILILVLYNPITYKLVSKMGETATYYRFLWIIPSWLACGYIVYEVLKKIQNEKIRVFIVFVISFGTIAMKVTPESFTMPDNKYQIPTETIIVANVFEEIMEDRGIEQVKILADREISKTIRQYDASIILGFSPVDHFSLPIDCNEKHIRGVVSLIYYNRNDMDYEVVEDILEDQEIEYIVLPKINDKSLSYLQNLQWNIIRETENYYILN